MLYLGDTIIQKGTEGNVFYLIKEGTVRVSDVGDGKTYLDHDLGPGEYFGERALITGEPRAANIQAFTNVTLMALDRLSFDSLLGPLKEVLNQNMIVRVLDSLKWFKDFSASLKLRVAREFVLETYETGSYNFFVLFRVLCSGMLFLIELQYVCSAPILSNKVCRSEME